MKTRHEILTINPYEPSHLPCEGRTTSILLAVLWMVLAIPTSVVIGVMVLFVAGFIVNGIFGALPALIGLILFLVAYAAGVGTIFGMWYHGIKLLRGEE